jgi:hypothetical protein
VAEAEEPKGPQSPPIEEGGEEPVEPSAPGETPAEEPNGEPAGEPSGDPDPVNPDEDTPPDDGEPTPE